MIKSFSATNVRNFNEFNIDFSINKSKRIGELTNSDDFFKLKNNKILKIVGITGANASGKTTLLELLKIYEMWTYHYLLLNTAEKKASDFFFLQEVQNAYKQDPKKVPEMSSLNKWINTEEHIKKILEEFSTTFKYYFDTNCFNVDKPIIYQVSFINNNNEELNHYLEIHKSGTIIFKLENLSKHKIIINEQYDYLLFENTIMNIKTNKIFNTFYENVNTSFVCVSSLFDSNPISIENFIIPSAVLNNPFKLYREEVNNHIYEYLKEEKNKIKFIEWLKLADSTIDNIVDNQRLKKIDFFIKQNGDNVDWTRLSKGTLKWIYFFYMLEIKKFVFDNKNQNSDKIIFIDEIENYLHSKLVKAFLRIISQSNQKIQLIFTTHHTYLFDETFRHEGIYLIENNYDKSLKWSHNLNCLSKYNLKKDKKIFKLFLDEKIGSHPDGISILDWVEKYYGRD